MDNTNIIKLLWERIDALERLLVCYRITKRPTEKLCKQLERTEKGMKDNALEILKIKD